MHCAADRSHTICMLSVPATMTCHDLLTFTAACHQDIQHFRILRDSSPNQYMALITFRSSVSMYILTDKVYIYTILKQVAFILIKANLFIILQ